MTVEIVMAEVSSKALEYFEFENRLTNKIPEVFRIFGLYRFQSEKKNPNLFGFSFMY